MGRSTRRADTEMNVEGRMSRRKDVTYLRDVIALAMVLQRRGDSIQALLHARRALKGFRKVESTDDIRGCLRLLIELCNAEDVEEDEEVYAIMLSRLPDLPSSSTLTVPKDVSSGPTLEVAMSIAQDRERKGAEVPIGEWAPERPLTSVLRVEAQQEDNPSSTLQQVREGEGDMLPYEVRPNHPTRHRNGKFHEVLIAGEGTRKQPQGAQETMTTDADELSERPVGNRDEESTALLQRKLASALLDPDAYVEDIAQADGTIDEMVSDGVSQVSVYADGVRDDVEPTCSGLTEAETENASSHYQETSQVPVANDSVAIADNHDVSFAHDWATSAIDATANRASKSSNTQAPQSWMSWLDVLRKGPLRRESATISIQALQDHSNVQLDTRTREGSQTPRRGSSNTKDPDYQVTTDAAQSLTKQAVVILPDSR